MRQSLTRNQPPFPSRPPSQTDHPDHPLTRFTTIYCFCGIKHVTTRKICKVCQTYVNQTASPHYKCQPCGFVIHVDCVCFSPEAYHTSHRQHPVNSLKCQVPDYADKKCLLCAKIFDKQHHQLHHCDVCNLSICRACMKDPPPVHVECLKTHEHQLHLVPRRINFTCNACGTQGGQSPYFCLLCNYMIHRECIDLPCVININRHDHHISYTPRLGHGEWKCEVCHEKIDGFYGAYTVGIVKAHVQLFIIRLVRYFPIWA